MSIRQKTILISVSTLLGLFILLYGTAQAILLDGFIQLAGAAARKVATSGAYIGQKQGVTHKYAQPLNVIGHIGRCVAGYVHGLYLKGTDLELLLILEQRIEGCAVGLDFGLYIEDATERGLHLLDVLADALPEVDRRLPRDLAVKRIPSELCNLLNRDQRSPFFQTIKRLSGTPGDLKVEFVVPHFNPGTINAFEDVFRALGIV